jgi:DNA repair protein RecN (Recombination protein N)
VQFLFTANPGAAPGPLGKVASGGELSRVRLALEVVLASSGQTLLPDEDSTATTGKLKPRKRTADSDSAPDGELPVTADPAAGSQTFVFDEVDAGVGGEVALEIGRRLRRLAEHAQVIVVTHLAQVAAFADKHFVVTKADDGQVSVSDVREVSGPDRLNALAKMMSGLGSDSAVAHAADLLRLTSLGPTGR